LIIIYALLLAQKLKRQKTNVHSLLKDAFQNHRQRHNYDKEAIKRMKLSLPKKKVLLKKYMVTIYLKGCA